MKRQIKNLFDDISQLPKIKKYVSSGNIRDNFEKIIKEFNSCSKGLNLTISIATNEQMVQDLAKLDDEMKKVCVINF